MLTKGYWIHDRFKDVFIEVITYEGKHHGQDVYTIDWFNRGQTPGKYFCIGLERDMLGIEPDDYKNWKQYDPETRVSMEPVKPQLDTEKLPTYVKVICGFCAEEFLVYRINYRERMGKSKSGKLYCTQKCAGQALSRSKSK